MDNKLKNSHFTISLDFELMWGMFDKVNIDQYGKNIKGAHEVIPKILNMFSSYDIHATWATVGMLMYDSQFTLATALPTTENRPQYKNSTLSAYQHLKTNLPEITAKPEFYFAPDLTKKIVNTTGQELASHTFSHYYCMEEQDVSSEKSESLFTTDCRALQKSLAQFGTTATSIIFPRNQWTNSALNICAENGITTYRGTQNHFLYKARPEQKQTNLAIRGLRLLDHYINISGHHTFSIDSINQTDIKLINIPASRQMRPYSKKLSWLESLRLRRIKKAMTHAAKNGEIFHLWWHPHNFGKNQRENIKNLHIIIKHFQTLKKTYGMQSKNMQELTLATQTST